MPINIFISSRMEGVEKEKRKLAKEAIKEMGDAFKPILFEDEPPDSKHTRDWWRDKIKDENTKFMILILNDTLSAAVFDEFRTAVENGVKTFVFLIDGSYVSDEKLKIVNYPVIPRDELDWFYRTVKSKKCKYKKIKGDDEFKKDIKKAISQYLAVSPEVPQELRTYILSKDEPELKRILEVYVKPKGYEKAYSILDKRSFLVITGDANIGKTSMAQHLANCIRTKHNLARIIKIEGGRKDIGLFKNLKNSAIIFDDAFGRSAFSDLGDYSNNIDDIEKLIENNNNFVIITTRKQILDEVKKRPTRFTEYLSHIEDRIIEFSQEGSYSDDALRKIFKKHVSYYRETGKISDKEETIAQENREKIINNLRFPHNIDILVKEELKKVTEGLKELDEAIEAAKHIKTIAKNWFLNLEFNKKYFIFTVALFPGFDEKTFDMVYEKLIELLQRRHRGLITEDLNAIRRYTSAYITETGRIDFRHPNYREGVIEGISKECKKDLVEIIPALGKLAIDPDTDFDVKWRVAYILGKIGKIKPEKALPLLKELAKDEPFAIRRRVAIALGMIAEVKPDETLLILTGLAKDDDGGVRMIVAYALGKIGKIKSEKTLPLLKELAKDNFPLVRWSVADALGEIGEIKPEEVLPLLKELAKDENPRVREAAETSLWKIKV